MTEDRDEMCESIYCPYSHTIDEESCYEAWKEAGQARSFFDMLLKTKQQLAEDFDISESTMEGAETAGLESICANDADAEDYGVWLRLGREHGWLIYRQNPESYTPVPDITGGDTLGILFQVTQSNWESVRQDLTDSQLVWIGTIAVRLLENAFTSKLNEKNAEALTQSPIEAFLRVQEERRRRYVEATDK